MKEQNAEYPHLSSGYRRESTLTHTHVHVSHIHTCAHTTYKYTRMCVYTHVCTTHTHIYIAKQAPGAFNLIDEQFTFPFLHIVSGDFTSMFSSTFSDFVIMAVMTRMELPSFL